MTDTDPDLETMMPAINFDRRFALPISSGMKLLTMRVPRVDGRAPGMTEPGAMTNLYTGLRTRAARLVATVECLAVAEVRFGPKGFERIAQFGPGTIRGQSTPGVLALVDCTHQPPQAGSLDRLARLDGFETWDQLWAWHSDVETKRVPSRAAESPVTRHMVVWRAPLVP